MKSAVLLSVLAVCCTACNNGVTGNKVPTYREFREQAFEQLVDIRANKVKRVRSWLENQKHKLEDGKNRSRLIELFAKMNNELKTGFNKKRFLNLNQIIEKFLIYQLSAFYDLLFINADGLVFYSVKMEDDFRSSLIKGAYADTKLARTIRNQPEQLTFVDFQYYRPSDEAAAFYVLPVKENGRYKGSVALQFSINHLNQLLIERTGLGRTGEAYLVNEKQMMLTESRFINTKTVLTKRIDTKAVKNTTGPEDQTVIRDYRDVSVLSTFRSFHVGGTTWRIIVEKDEKEVITNFYKKYSARLFPDLAEAAAKQTNLRKTLAEKHLQTNGDAKRVDVSELIRQEGSKKLFTPGLATCTGIVAHSGSGDFAYMAHLSPLDDSYLSSHDNENIKGNQSTDLVSLMMRRINFFEIKPCRRHELQFIVAATHTASLKRIIGKLISSGIFLSQIRAGIFENTDSISLCYDPCHKRLLGVANANGKGDGFNIDFSRLADLGSLASGL